MRRAAHHSALSSKGMSDMPMERKAKGLLFAYNETRLLIFCTDYEGRELFNQKIAMAQT
jgi:hypothetical protein